MGKDTTEKLQSPSVDRTMETSDFEIEVSEGDVNMMESNADNSHLEFERPPVEHQVTSSPSPVLPEGPVVNTEIQFTSPVFHLPKVREYYQI